MCTNPKRVWRIVGMIAAVSAALVLIGHPVTADQPPVQSVTVSSRMTQAKVLKGSDGYISMALTLSAAGLPPEEEGPKPAVDFVIVLDRSGSMEGAKIEAARSAVAQLIQRLGPDDRLALVTYSDGVELVAPLTAMDGYGRKRLARTLRQVVASGYTNLGGGLHRGIDLFVVSPGRNRQRSVILISDGLANRGVTDPAALGQMAAGATDHRFTVSTVGVGLDFNELLMTHIADHGAGRYYFLDDPLVFARVFEKEFHNARQVAAAEIGLRITLAPGVRLIDAGGYPIRMEAGASLIHPGNLVAGEQRTLFLTFQVPTDRVQVIPMGAVRVDYVYGGHTSTIESASTLSVLCVENAREVMESVDKEIWSQKVVREEYSRLKEQVADAVRNGDLKAAESKIMDYDARQRSLNAGVGSEAVAEHLDGDIQHLRQSVTETFAGPPSAVGDKQKNTSKRLQYESYQQRRGKQ